MTRDRSPAYFPLYQATERWVFRRLGRIEHERRVVRIAAALFRLTRPLHDLDSADFRLLLLGCLIHDVGRKISDKRHPTVGAKMLANDRHLPVDESQRRALMYLTRYHRSAVPELGYDDILRNGDGRKRLRLILALLRAADSLDNRQLTPPALSFSLDGRRLRIACKVHEKSGKARRVYARRKKYRLLEELLDCKVMVQIKSGAHRAVKV